MLNRSRRLRGLQGFRMVQIRRSWGLFPSRYFRALINRY